MESSAISDKLKDEGWNLSSLGLEQVTENGKFTDIKFIINKLLDVDLRLVSAGTLPEDINKTKYESVPGGIVLQLQKVKNLSSPKYQETLNCNPDPNIIKVVLTDGVNNVQGVAVEHIPHLNLNTAPGSKIFLTGPVEIAHCFLLLNKENTSVIGGRVELLIEKWELNRKLAKHKRDLQEEGGPPPWIPFGQKICKPVVTDRNFKSLEQGKVKEIENSEFEAQRQDAILEAASKIGAPKVFGGGNNKLLDHNVQVIVDAGFTVEQAEYALKVCKNNKDRALRSLMSKHAKSSKEDDKKKEEKPERVREGGKPGKGRGRNREEEGSSLKPSAKVSLFDFLEDKLPASEKDSQPEIRNSFEAKFNKPVRMNDPQQQLLKSLGEDRRGRDENKFSARRNDREGPHGRHEDRRGQDRERKADGVKFEGRRNYYDQQRADKSFGNFKVKNDYGSKTETVKIGPRWSDKRDPKPGQSKNYSKDERTYEDDMSRNKTSFVAAGEKPPRFQRMSGQQNEMGQQWEPKTTNSYPTLPPPEFRNNRQQANEFSAPNNNCIPPSPTGVNLQNSLASLSLQQSLSSFNHTPDARNVTSPGNKNLYFPSLGSESRVTAQAYQRGSPAPFIPQDIKPTYPGMPTVPDYPFKANGAMMQGYNDFQAVFGGAVRTANASFNSQSLPFGNQQPNMAAPTAFSNSQPHFTHSAPPVQQPFTSGNFNAQATPTGNVANYTAPFMSAAQLMHPPPPTPQQPTAPRRWSWKKGNKCYARYWEDQNYYEALVTGVSENTCVVHFIEYGNYEEVLHDDCVPIDGIPPDT